MRETSQSEEMRYRVPRDPEVITALLRAVPRGWQHAFGTLRAPRHEAFMDRVVQGSSVRTREDGKSFTVRGAQSAPLQILTGALLPETVELGDFTHASAHRFRQQFRLAMYFFGLDYTGRFDLASFRPRHIGSELAKMILIPETDAPEDADEETRANAPVTGYVMRLVFRRTEDITPFAVAAEELGLQLITD